MAGRAMDMISTVINSNTFVNTCLLGCFGVLGLRSMNQQNLIESLEAERDNLIKTNKAMKKSLWDWKQQLYADASSPDTAIVPLSRLKAIYGDVVSAPSAVADGDSKKAGKSSSKIVI